MAASLDIETPSTCSSSSGSKIKPFPKPRFGKKLLVLDLDMTVYDSTPEGKAAGPQAIRPHLHAFLKSAYEDYDIIIWSATSLKVIDEKLELLNIRNDTADYKILYYWGRSKMTTTPSTGATMRVKQLEPLWKRFPQFDAKGTVICDDSACNFHLNPENGILVEPYSYRNFKTDRELIYLSRYLKHIAKFYDVTAIDHSNWKKCISTV